MSQWEEAQVWIIKWRTAEFHSDASISGSWQCTTVTDYGDQGCSTQFWTLSIGILHGPLLPNLYLNGTEPLLMLLATHMLFPAKCSDWKSTNPVIRLQPFVTSCIIQTDPFVHLLCSSYMNFSFWTFYFLIVVQLQIYPSLNSKEWQLSLVYVQYVCVFVFSLTHALCD